MAEDLVSVRHTADDKEALDCDKRHPASGVRCNMRPSPRKALLALVAALGAAFGFTATAVGASRTLTGAGSTLVAPLESEWASGFAAGNPGNKVNFLPLGSGTGIQYLARGLVDFGATDAPPSAMGGVACSGCALVPWALSATGIGYNIGGVGAGLKLTGKVLAEIYLGEISNWDSRQISKLNPGIHLPNLKITPIFRSDTSGDSYAFTGYLSAVSSAWFAKNRAATIYFPGSVGVPEKGNAAMAGAIRSIKGAVGYVSASYLLTMKITAARIQNSRGNFEYPNPTNIENAAAEVKIVPAGNVLRIVSPPKKYKVAYPISTFSYALVHATGNANGSLLKRWLTYCVTAGRLAGFGLDFVPIPNVVQAAALRTINSIS
jgi:phosphate transport system substrate-binding protein